MTVNEDPSEVKNVLIAMKEELNIFQIFDISKSLLSFRPFKNV